MSSWGEKLRVIHRWESNVYNEPPIMSDINDYFGNVDYGKSRVFFENGYTSGGLYFFYIRDHLGSVRIAINERGAVYQSMEYYPFGMPYSESLGHNHQPFKYNGQEFETMNGLNLYDYEFRRHDPSTGRFLTIDPLAEKYPWISPYAYCMNNPVRYIDPDGRDIWEINEMGEIIKRMKDKMEDAFYMVAKDAGGKYQRTFTTDADGNKNYNSISFEYGTVESQRTTALNSTDTYDTYKVRGDANGTQIFEFLSQNTNVEWSQAKTGVEGDKGLNFLTTSHDEKMERGMTNLINGQLVYKYTAREFNHNHPKNERYNHIPSGIPGLTGDGGDVSWSQQVSNIFGNQVKFSIYTPNTRKYHPFGPYSKKSDYIK
jgi:RHS repeat-associated protein